MSESDKNEERMLNYERYRTLVQNEAVGSKFEKTFQNKSKIKILFYLLKLISN